jgi:hypothetical protein
MTKPESTLIEALWSGADPPDAPILRIRPAVVDTSAFISDVMDCLRSGMVSPLLSAMRLGVVRVFVAQHVWAEVPRALATLGEEGRLDAAAAEALWWTTYVPLVRVVDVGRVPRSPTKHLMADRDWSDSPTDALVALLSPVVALASDRDLIDLGLAAKQWRPVARAGAVVALGSGGLHAGSGLTVAFGAGALEGASL